MKFEVYDLNFISEQWGDAADDFLLQAHCEVRESGMPGGEAFIVDLVSPKALQKELENSRNIFPSEFGRGYLIVADINKQQIINILQKLINGSNSNNWEDLYSFISKYFNWID